MSLAFEWIDFPEGRARFSGTVRGGDEAGHDTFSIERDGREAFGEYASRYAGRDLSLEVLSFGYARQRQVGPPSEPFAYSETDAVAIERLVRALVATVAARSERLDKPAALRFDPPTRFTGEIVFRAGWIRTGVVTAP